MTMISSDPASIAEAKRLRRLHISVPDIMRQTGLTMFEVYECTESREIAVIKLARLHYIRGTGWPWDDMATDPDQQQQPSGDDARDAARAIVDLFRGRSLDAPLRQILDAFPVGERKQLVEIVAHIIRRAASGGRP